jgi:hypothetical protein
MTNDEAQAIVTLINRLRNNSEGASVVICCTNPEGCGPDNEQVFVYDKWTDWESKGFSGKTLFDVLHAADAARALAEKK